MVGHSINLYNRISSYFMPSILKTKARRVLRYLNKYGFTEINLTIYIVDISTSLEELINLEQHFINTLNPKLNVDLIARGSGYHEPMSLEIREKLRKQRGTPVFIYDSNDFSLLHIFDSKQHLYNSISIHHKNYIIIRNILLSILSLLARVLSASPTLHSRILRDYT